MLTLTGSVAGSYTVIVTGTSGTITHSVTITVTVNNCVTAAPPILTQSNWKQRLSLSKNNFMETWSFGIKNPPPSMTPNPTTIFFMIEVDAVPVDGGSAFTVTTPIFSLAPNGVMNNIQLTQTFTNANIGQTYTFTIQVLWGTTSALGQNGFQNPSGLRTSGSFTILP